jgi:hypothetical protein
VTYPSAFEAGHDLPLADTAVPEAAGESLPKQAGSPAVADLCYECLDRDQIIAELQGLAAGETQQRSPESPAPKEVKRPKMPRSSSGNLKLLHDACRRISKEFPNREFPNRDSVEKFTSYFIGIVSNYLPKKTFAFCVERAEFHFRESEREEAERKKKAGAA